jgi:hypothetical protein
MDTTIRESFGNYSAIFWSPVYCCIYRSSCCVAALSFLARQGIRHKVKVTFSGALKMQFVTARVFYLLCLNCFFFSKRSNHWIDFHYQEITKTAKTAVILVASKRKQ